MLNKIIIIILISYSTACFSLQDDAQVPILLYHTQWAGKCDSSSNDVLALERDLKILHENGWTVLPVQWLVDWASGKRDGSTLPDKVVGITIDDGFDADWISNLIHDHECAPLKSAKKVVEAFVHEYKNSLPEHSPHISLFVIASKEARKIISPEYMNDNWWAEANAHNHFSIQSHGTDHDFFEIKKPIWDDSMQVILPTSSLDDGIYQGKMQPQRHISKASNTNYIAKASDFIEEKTGSRPTLLAYPMGRASDYTQHEYLPNYTSEHGIYAAFCTYNRKDPFLHKKTNLFCIPRLTYKHAYTTGEELLKFLQRAESDANQAQKPQNTEGSIEPKNLSTY